MTVRESKTSHELAKMIADLSGERTDFINVQKIGLDGNFRATVVATTASDAQQANIEAICERLRQKYRLTIPRITNAGARSLVLPLVTEEHQAGGAVAAHRNTRNNHEPHRSPLVRPATGHSEGSSLAKRMEGAGLVARRWWDDLASRDADSIPHSACFVDLFCVQTDLFRRRTGFGLFLFFSLRSLPVDLLTKCKRRQAGQTTAS
jgi:hypothetical protein